MALANRGVTDGLREVALAGARRTEEESVLASLDEACSCEIEDEASIHLLVAVEVQAVQRLPDVAKLRMLDPALQQAVAPSVELISDQRRDEVDRRHPFGLRPKETRFNGSRKTGQP